MSPESQSTLRPIRQQTLTESVAEQIRLAIRNGSLAPGERLVEREISRRLEVSRIPVREAIQQLVDEGLVVKVPRRGAFVYSPSPREVDEIASLRIVLGQFVAERVIERWQPDHETELRSIVDQMKEAALRQDHYAVFELDARFHRLLGDLADHKLLMEVAAGLRARMSRMLLDAVMALPVDQLLDHALGHEYYLQVILQGDVSVAREFVAEHVQTGRDRIKAG